MKNQYLNTNHFFRNFVALALSMLFAQTGFAQSIENQQIVFEGSLTDNSGNPINLSGEELIFYVTTNSCYLYGESSFSAGDSQGNIIHRIGSGTMVAGSPHVFHQNLFFGSTSGTTSLGDNCNASINEIRLVQVVYPEQNITATMKIGTVPYAQSAKTLSGKIATDFVATSSDTQTVFSNGNPGQYLTKSAGGLTWSNLSITAAQISNALGYTPTSTTATLTSINADNISSGFLTEARFPNISNITSGSQYIKVTVDGKGRVTSGSQLSNTDITTALGYQPVSATQWNTSGTTINYLAGNVGIGTTSPTSVLNIVNDNGAATKDDLQINTFGPTNTAALVLQRARGTAATPTNLMTNDAIGNLRWDGYIGGAYTNLVAVSGYAETDLGTSVNSYLTISTNSNGTMAERVRVSSNGNVSIGTISSATAKLHVAGAVVSKPHVITTGTTVDLSLSNMFILNSIGGSANSSINITLNNMTDGGTYTLIITDTIAHTYSFDGCTTSLFSPANSLTVPGTRSIFGLITVKNGAYWDCYINWTPGYQ